MSCSNPLIAIPSLDVNPETGKTQYKILPNDGMRRIEDVLRDVPGARLIPCGRCMECRLAHSRQWADRMMLELEDQKKAIFLTLTYDKEHLPVSSYQSVVVDGFLPRCSREILQGSEYYIPEYSSLCKRDLQLFLKRLRKALDPLKLRYYACGEYGDHTLRPHYHMILYGLSVDDFKLCSRGCFCRDCPVSEDQFRSCRNSMIRISAGRSELGDQYYTSPFLEKIWKNGNVLFSEVSWKTCAYVARYVTKKWNGDYKVDYMVRNCIPEFSLQSRRPGIGRRYFENHPDVLDFSSIHLSTPDGGLKMSIPKYFLRIGEVDFPEKTAIIKERNLQASLDAMQIRSSQTSLPELAYQRMKELSKKDSVKQLRRNKI